MFDPVKAGFGRYLEGFYSELYPTTRGMGEFCNRGFKSSFAWAAGRMADQAEEMLAAWHKNDAKQPTRPPKLPAVLVAVGDDFTPVSASMGAQVVDGFDIQLKNDDLQRWVKLKVVSGEQRAQVVIFAHDEGTAKSIASQLSLYMSAPSNRGFNAWYPFGGSNHAFPVLIEAPDGMASQIDTGQQNIKALAVDINLIVNSPIILTPKNGEASDGLGDDTQDNPSGYPVTTSIDINKQKIVS